MTGIYNTLRDRLAGHPGPRWLSLGMLAVVFLWDAWLTVAGIDPIASGIEGALDILLLVMPIVPVIGLAMNQRWGFQAARYVAALLFFGWLKTAIRGGRASFLEPAVNPAYAVIAVAWFVTLFAVVTLGIPRERSPEIADGEPPAEGRKKRKSHDPLEWTRDNVEAIVVAFLMALIIRCFCVEVFKIPTGSMEPTLYGDTKPTDALPHHTGDRIMVDKVGLMFEPVFRYDVCVFKYPLDRSRNFIKRIVGLPDEDLWIDKGDIWTRPHKGGDGKFRIARKPAKEQPGIWLPAWPGEDVSREFCRKKWDGAADDCYLGNNAFDTGPAKGNAVFRFHQIIDGNYKGLGSSSRVHDLRVAFRATFAEGKGMLFVRNNRADGYGSLYVTVSAEGKVKVDHQLDPGGTFQPAGAPHEADAGKIEAGTEIEVANFDGSVRVRVDGKEVLAYEYVNERPETLRAIDPPQFQILFGTQDGAAKFEDVTVGRDIYYFTRGDNVFAGREYLEIPEGKYLAIGDNVGNSKDGRLWRERVLTLKDGRELLGDYDSQEHYPQDNSKENALRRFRDLDGTDHFFQDEDIDDDGSGRPRWHPFVSREELVGKALIVWWPLKRFKVIR
ncbi:MAG: signal peptidase I [Planctomycetes bacterium]|nr:signal peptidase I [Planctomycetota bacterium]